MKYTIPDCGKGVNFDLLPSELEPGVWSAGTYNYRFRSGFAQLWDGAALYFDTPAIIPQWGMPYATASAKYGFYVTSTKAYYADSAANSTEITRKTDGIVITNLTSAGTTVTATTASAHGLTAASSVVDVYGALPSTYNATGVTVATTPTATTFTYTVASAPAVSPATSFGAYSGSATSNFSALSGLQRYSGGPFNGLMLFNHPGAGLYYWNGDTSTKLRKLPGFSGTSTWNTAVAVHSFKGFVVAVGTTEDGVYKRQNIKWSNAVTDPNSIPNTWVASDTNQAGETNLTETAGAAVDCLPMGDVNIVYMADARYAMQYLKGSDQVFEFTRLPGDSGLAFPNCVVDTPVGHVFLTPDYDVMVSNGGEPRSIAAGRVKQFLQANITPAYAHLSFLCLNPLFEEVMVCFAKNASTCCDKAFVWNYKDDKWGYVDLASGAVSTSGVTFASHGQWPNALPQVENQNCLGYLCSHTANTAFNGIYTNAEGGGGGLFFGASISGVLDREGLDCGDRDRLKTLQRSRWNIDGNADTFQIRHGSSMFADTAATNISAITYTVGSSDFANGRATQGRFIAIRATTLVHTGTPSVRSIDLDITPGGTR
jgi:hypothetical protein